MSMKIICGPSASEISAILLELATIFDITHEGEIDNYYLGVKITRPSNSLHHRADSTSFDPIDP